MMLFEQTNDLYIDGSYNTNTYEYGSGIVHIVNGKNVFETKLSGNDLELSKQRNVAGEMRAAMGAVAYAIKNNLKSIRLHYDYYGIEYWATGKWKRNNTYTQKYHEFMSGVLNNSELKIRFIKVKAHSGDPFNDRADKLAKEACGLIG